MMEKLAQAGGRGVHAHPFHSIPSRIGVNCKVAVYAPAERAVTFTLFHLYPYVCTLWTELSKVYIRSPIYISLKAGICFNEYIVLIHKGTDRCCQHIKKY